jgi:signal peptidase I
MVGGISSDEKGEAPSRGRNAARASQLGGGRTVKLLKLASLIAIAGLAVAWFILLRPVFLGGSATYIIVSGASMEPGLRSGDLAVLHRQADYQPGDVVVFGVGGGGAVIHRIIGGDSEEGFQTQGDNQSRPDLWRPTLDDIGGKLWFSVPGVGRFIDHLQQPLALATIVTFAGIGSLGFWGSRRRRKRHGRQPNERRRGGPPASNGAPPTRGEGATLLVLATLFFLAAGATAYMWLRPVDRVETMERIRYEHTGEFRYTATVTPSVVYDSPTIVSPADGTSAPPIFTSLLRDLRVDFDYTMATAVPAQAWGDVSADLRIRAGDPGWTRTLPLLEPQPFEGTAASAGFSVDVAAVHALVATAAEQTGFSPSRYELAVVVRVGVAGEANGSIDDTFVVELPMEMTSTLLTIGETLAASETVTGPEQVTVANDLELLGVSLPVQWGRGVATGALALLLLTGMAYALAVRRRLGSGPVAKIRLRYGRLIVPVTGPVPTGSRRVEVTSIADLVRLARGAEQVVFYDRPGNGKHRFFVPDGAVTYEYRIGSTPKKAEQ